MVLTFENNLYGALWFVYDLYIHYLIEFSQNHMRLVLSPFCCYKTWGPVSLKKSETDIIGLVEWHNEEWDDLGSNSSTLTRCLFSLRTRFSSVRWGYLLAKELGAWKAHRCWEAHSRKRILFTQASSSRTKPSRSQFRSIAFIFALFLTTQFNIH